MQEERDGQIGDRPGASIPLSGMWLQLAYRRLRRVRAGLTVRLRRSVEVIGMRQDPGRFGLLKVVPPLYLRIP